MKLFVECMVKDVSKESFVKDGETVEYYVNSLKNHENEKLEVNSKNDSYSQYEGKWGVATIEVGKKMNGELRLSLREFKPGIALETDPDTEIH